MNEHSSVPIVLALMAACSVLVVAILEQVDRETLALLAALGLLLIVTVCAGRVIALVVDWLRWMVWPWLQEREGRKEGQR